MQLSSSIYIQHVFINHHKKTRNFREIELMLPPKMVEEFATYLKREPFAILRPPDAGGCTGASTGAAFMASWLRRLYGDNSKSKNMKFHILKRDQFWDFFFRFQGFPITGDSCSEIKLQLLYAQQRGSHSVCIL